MAEIATKKRNALPDSRFADPENRKFPIHDAAHVRNAAARLAQQVKRGAISASKAAEIHERIAAAGKKFGVEVTSVDAPTRDRRARPPKTVHVRADLAPGGALHVRHMREFYDGEGVLLTSAASDGDVPVWIQVAKSGAFAGHPAGPFELNTKVFDEIVGNFKATTNRSVPIDYEHASEADATSGSIPTAGAPAQGWIRDLKIDGGNLYGLVEWLPQARDQIRSGQYKYLSPAIRFGSKDRVTGKPIGARLTSAALTNVPFLDGMAPLAAKDAEAATHTLAAKTGLGSYVHSHHEYMPAIKSALKMPALCSAMECSDHLDKLREACMSAGPSGMYDGVQLSEYTKPLGDLVGATPGMTWEQVFDVVEDMIAHAIDQHVEEMHPDAAAVANGDDGDTTTMTDAAITTALKDAQTQVSALTLQLSEAGTKLKDAEAKRVEAESQLATVRKDLDAANATIALKDGELKALKDGDLKTLREEKAKREEADLTGRVDAAIRTYKDKKGLTEEMRPHLMAVARATPEAFATMYPPVQDEQQYLLRALTPPEPGRDQGQGGGTATSGLTLHERAERLRQANPALSYTDALNRASALPA